MIRAFVIPEMTGQRGLMPCASIRLFLPLTKESMIDAVKPEFASVDDLEFQCADVVIAHRISLPSLEHVEKVERYCQSTGAKFIYDIDDDLLALGSHHTQSQVYESLKPIVRRALTSADQIWVSTEVLAERYRQFGRDIAVVPNVLDRRVWRPAVGAQARDQVTRFLYMGTPTHRDDFSALILPSFARLRREFASKVSLTVVGVLAEGSPDKRYFTINVPPHIALSYPAFAGWFQSLGPYDVGLAPLLDTSFNRAKSNIKQLEYSALGLPTIAADLPPYRNAIDATRATMLVDPTPDAFYFAMRSLVLDSDKCRELQAAAHVIGQESLCDVEKEEPRLQLIQKLVDRNKPTKTPSILDRLPSDHGGDSQFGYCATWTRLFSSADMRSAAHQIAKSGLFDPEWYLHTYPDVADAGMDPLEHFIRYGGQERRNPSPHFDTAAYFAQHRDVLEAAMNPLLHYVVHGREKGRIICPVVKRHDEFMPPVDPGPIPKVARCVAFFFTNADQTIHRDAASVAQLHTAERKLAKRYGVEGFCYYIDGFADGGAQDELLKFVLSAEDDFAFCVCWTDARESRGESSPDLPTDQSPPRHLATAFSKRIAPFLRHKNYLRIDGRPIILVHQAAFIPHIAEMADQWRDYARRQGLGELLLVSAHTPNLDPTLIGFDAAIESAPNKDGRFNLARPNGAQGSSLDYRDLVRMSYSPISPAFPLFRTVCAGPQEPVTVSGDPVGLHHSSPAAYQEWLENNCKVGGKLGSGHLVFVDSWNGSAGAASLQPTPNYGHAYLNATAKALQTLGMQEHVPSIAVIAHVFYEDVWPEIAFHLRRWKIPFRLYASVPNERAEKVANLICSDFPKALITAVPNRGRDIAPFLNQAKSAITDGVELICKIHTKKSSHRADGDEWRQDLYEKLLGGEGCPEKMRNVFTRNAALGVVAPEGHLIPCEFYWGANADRVFALAQQIGYPGDPNPLMFAAGSMFWIQSLAFEPILKLDIQSDDFEEECGQADGTLAHAIERLIPIAAKMTGCRIVDTRVVDGSSASANHLRSDGELAHLEKRRPGYRFAPASRTA